jgi:exoribonuclease R
MADGSVRLLSQDLEHHFTLDQDQLKNVISMYVTIDNTGNIVDYYITENVIKVSRNLSYNKSNQLFQTYEEYTSPILRDLYDVACLLESHNPNKKTYWYKKDNSSLDKKISQSKSDKIIAEFMVLYNRLVARLMCNESLPYVYRIQDPSYIQSLIKKMNIEIDDSTKKTIDEIYMDSKYSIQPRYHNGLHIPIYSHSTDTLRRYPDMYNLYLLHSFYFKDLPMEFDLDKFEDLIAYFNQRNVELSLMESEYERALKLKRVKNQS